VQGLNSSAAKKKKKKKKGGLESKEFSKLIYLVAGMAITSGE
jgi:hypothetical protein